ncbi:MAG: hypothetical protein AAEJ65_07560, partial [Planctomycetota bacterium]
GVIPLPLRMDVTLSQGHQYRPMKRKPPPPETPTDSHQKNPGDLLESAQWQSPGQVQHKKQ